MRDLYKEILDFPNIYRAYLDARKCKRYRSSILKFGCNIEENLFVIKRDLSDKTYKHGTYREFVISDSKKRNIKAAPFRDRVVHHALCNIIEPILDKGFIYDSYACRNGKGTHSAVKRLEKFIRSASADQKKNPSRIFCLKCDISKYFDSVDQEILINILRKKIGDSNVLWLVEEIIKSSQRGIPIGNLTSQLFANVYLNELDHYVKRILKEKHYIRYMDDFLILGKDKKKLAEEREKIRFFLEDNLKLILHPKKSEIFPVDKGVDFLGYVIKGNKRYLRKSTVKRFIRKRKKYSVMHIKGKISIDAIERVNNSWKGYAKFANSYMLLKKLNFKIKA
jgi:retron-type reverse transcriptase